MSSDTYHSIIKNDRHEITIDTNSTNPILHNRNTFYKSINDTLIYHFETYKNNSIINRINIVGDICALLSILNKYDHNVNILHIDTYMTYDITKEIILFLEKNYRISCLILSSDHDISGLYLEKISYALGINKYIKQLSLEFYIDDYGIETLVKNLKANKVITELSLHLHTGPDELFKIYSKAIMYILKKCTSINKLSIFLQHDQMDCLHYITKGLQYNRNLQQLCIHYNDDYKFDNKVHNIVKKFLKCMVTNNNITHLHIDHRLLNNGHYKYIYNMIKYNRTLIELGFRKSIGSFKTMYCYNAFYKIDKYCTNIMKAFKKNNTIVNFIYTKPPSFRQLNDKDLIQQLINVSKKRVSFTRLELNELKVDINFIESILKCNKYLQELDIYVKYYGCFVQMRTKKVIYNHGYISNIRSLSEYGSKGFYNIYETYEKNKHNVLQKHIRLLDLVNTKSNEHIGNYNYEPDKDYDEY